MNKLIVAIAASSLAFTIGCGPEDNDGDITPTPTPITGPTLPLPTHVIQEILKGSGDLGTLADGSGDATIDIVEGITVPTTIGIQPLVASPLPALSTLMPDHPHLLDERASGGVHGDSYNSSVTPLRGPLGINPSATYTSTLPGVEISMCTPMLRDLLDRLISLCVGIGEPSELVLFDPTNDFAVATQISTVDSVGFFEPGLGWYTRLDNLGRPIVITPKETIDIYEILDNNNPAWTVAETWDLSGEVADSEQILDVVPDWDGNFWYISGYGYAGHLNRGTGIIKSIRLAEDETFGTALAVTQDATFVLSTKALYRLETDAQGEIVVRWRVEYGEAASINGDLTAPTVFDGGNLIAFGLNDDNPTARVAVMKTSPDAMTLEERMVCEQEVFLPNKGFLDNTFVGYGKTLIVQNNFGGTFFELVEYEPGLARVDVLNDLSGCEVKWTDYTISSQVPPKLSTGDGYVYQYSRMQGNDADTHVWYLTAHDFEFGTVVSELFIGSGKRIDSPMLSLDFMPGGVMVEGVRNGIVTLKDNP